MAILISLSFRIAFVLGQCSDIFISSCHVLYFVSVCHVLNSNYLYPGVQTHPLRVYLDYVGYLYQRMDPLPEQERFEV